jgi:DNA repair protein RadA/Sms
MAKTRIKYVCQQCGSEQNKWMGKCPDCGAWNTFEEVVETPQPAAVSRRSLAIGASTLAQGAQTPIVLPEIKPQPYQHISVGYDEMNRVLGGGLVAGSLTLIGGEPGIGKSTLLLQVSGAIAQHVGPALYISGEESIEQVKMRAERLGITGEQLYLLASIELEVIVEAVGRLEPRFVVVDSIQTVLSSHLPTTPGSISQVRECTLQLMQLAKRTRTPIFIIGHVTKEGTVAGPKALEHIVDTVLYLEGERYHTYRLLRSVKNRFGATHEMGVFEMQGEGLVEVTNPSAVFLSDRSEREEIANGSAVVVSMEGTRPILVEVQALVTPSNLAYPRSITNGIDHNRLLMLLAVLTKRVRLNDLMDEKQGKDSLGISGQDTYVNVVGGFTLDEPAIDLGVAAAIASSYTDKAISPDTALVGEISLSGDLRPVGRLESRAREAARLGFKRIIIPKAGGGEQLRKKLANSDLPADFKIITASSLAVGLGIALNLK